VGQGYLDQRVRRDEQGTGRAVLILWNIQMGGQRSVSWQGPSPKVAGLRHRMRTMRVDQASKQLFVPVEGASVVVERGV